MLPPHLAPALKGTFGRDQLIGVKAFFGGAEGSDIAEIRGDGDYHEAGSRHPPSSDTASWEREAVSAAP